MCLNGKTKGVSSTSVFLFLVGSPFISPLAAEDGREVDGRPLFFPWISCDSKYLKYCPPLFFREDALEDEEEAGTEREVDKDDFPIPEVPQHQHCQLPAMPRIFGVDP